MPFFFCKNNLDEEALVEELLTQLPILNTRAYLRKVLDDNRELFTVLVEWGVQKPEEYITFYKQLAYEILDKLNKVYRMILSFSSSYFPSKLNLLIDVFSLAHRYERLKIVATFTPKDVLERIVNGLNLGFSDAVIALTPSQPTILARKHILTLRLKEILDGLEEPFLGEIVQRYSYVRYIVKHVYGYVSKLKRDLSNVPPVIEMPQISDLAYIRKRELLKRYEGTPTYRVLKVIDELLLVDHHEDILRRSRLDSVVDLLVQVKLLKEGLIDRIYLDFSQLIPKLKEKRAIFEREFEIPIPAVGQSTGVTCGLCCALNVLSTFYGLDPRRIPRREKRLLKKWRWMAGSRHHTYAIAVAHLVGQMIGYERVQYIVNEEWLNNLKKLAENGHEPALVNLKWTSKLPSSQVRVLQRNEIPSFSDYVNMLREGQVPIIAIDFDGWLHANLIRGYRVGDRPSLKAWDPLGSFEREVALSDVPSLRNRLGFVAVVISHPDASLVAECRSRLASIEKEFAAIESRIENLVRMQRYDR